MTTNVHPHELSHSHPGLAPAPAPAPRSITGRYDTVTCIDVMIHYPQDKADAMITHLAGLSDRRLVLSFAPKTPYYSVLKRIGELFPGPSKVGAERVTRAAGPPASRSVGLPPGQSGPTHITHTHTHTHTRTHTHTHVHIYTHARARARKHAVLREPCPSDAQSCANSRGDPTWSLHPPTPAPGAPPPPARRRAPTCTPRTTWRLRCSAPGLR